ncbi:protein FAM208B isoform X2 [Numida meleagris]|uniref:protein FAM208B isoform X2 n=1 Tax=Numida meleagris TaxID=8996 RepID=UPI000B3E16CA|nr:protein FAM208B isoform X2 [Numida meleagris]
MGERREEAARGPGAGLHPEFKESSSLLQTAVSVLQSSYLDSTSQDGFWYSQAILVENDVFLNELKAFVQAKEAAGYSQEELEETFAFLLFDNEEEAKEVCQTGLRVNSSSISMLGDPAKGVYISKYADCLHPRPWYHGKSGFIVICKLVKGKVKVVSENYTTSYTCPSPGYDCHVAMSRNIISSKSSPCQAFEQNQYYVYEVSDGSTAERPRQICPYIVISCQYREPKEMPILARESLPEPNHKALYCPWRGQLSIQGQLLCNIALRTPHSSTIPAQLPHNLDINHVMGLSDLKKKLPEAAFGKRNYIENEVCFQGVYFSLYEVEISSKDQHKMDQLLENLRKRDLAIIKYLQDQGVLILLTSSALARDDGFDPKEPVSLLALFLFSSSRSVCLRVEGHHPKRERKASDISLKIASVLPGLRYALQKATNSSWGDALGTNVCIKQHFQEYAKLEQNTQQASSQNTEAPSSSCLSPAKDEAIKSCTRHSLQPFSQLQHYLSNPSSYTLEMSAALGCLAGAAQSLCCNSETSRKADFSLAVPPNPIPPDVKGGKSKAAAGLDQSKGPTKDISPSSKLWVKQNKRKSSGTAVTSTRKKWSPLKMQIHPVGDSSRKRKATKKKVNLTFSFPKKTGLAANSNEPMLKLAHLQFPHRRKRGAEVLSAEFVHKTQSEPVQKKTSAPSSSGSETKRPKMLKNSDVKKIPVTETIAKPAKSKVIKSVANRPAKPHPKKPAESEWKDPFSILPSEVSPQSHAADSQTGEIYPGGVPGHGFSMKGNDYESHALNLLADLALGSCIPPFLPVDGGMIALSCSSSTDSAKEQQSHRKHKSSRSASDHEYHRVDKLAKAAVSSSKASPNQKLPPAGKTELKDSTFIPGEKSLGISSKDSQQTCVLPPRETTQEAAEVNKHSFISSEHSYASLMPEHSKKHRSVPYPGSALSRNGTRSSRAGPLVGKVLPFRHQNSTRLQCPFEAAQARPRSSLLPPRLKEDFAKSHTVSHCGESMKVTCQWEAEYLFHLDSRYTNDALEKTVIRALHGPWDSDLPDDVEEMKLILHMWVALFYSKPSKLLSSTRKVVEHSNPKKYVSLNSTGDFFELSDDSDGGFELETCPVDSRSDPDQTPSSSLDPSTCSQDCFHPEESPADSQTDANGTPGVVDSTVSSSSGEEEPSSTSSESPSLTEHADQSNLAGKYGTEEHVEPPKEELMDARVTPSPSAELGDAGEPQAVLSRENPHSQTLNFSPAPQDDAICTQHGGGEQPESRWAAWSGGGPIPPKESGSMEDAGHGTDSSWATSNGPQRSCDSTPSEASFKTHSNPTGLREEERESQDPIGHTGKEEEEVEEGKREKEDSENESAITRPVGLAFSERGDVELVNSAPPKDFGIPGDGPVPIPTASVLPCENESMPALSGGTGTGPQGVPGDTALNLGALQEPWGTVATPSPETNGVGLAHAGGPVSALPLSPDLSLVRGITTTSSCPSASGMLREGLEQKDEDRAPSAETWALAGNKAACTAGPESLHGQGPFLTLSPDSSSVCFDGGTGVGAAPEDRVATALLQTPPRSGPGGSLSPRCGGDASAELTLPSTGESHQDQKEVLEEGQCGSPYADHINVLDEPSGACDGQGFAFSCAAWAGGSGTEVSTDVHLGAEKPPKSDEVDTAEAPQELKTSLCDLLESDSSSWMREGESAGDIPPLTVAQHQQSSPDSPSLPSPHQDPSPHGTAAELHCCLLERSEQEPDLCPHGKPCKKAAATGLSVAPENPALDGSLKPGCAEGVKKDLGLCHAEPAESSPLRLLTPGEPGSRPCSPHGHETEPDPVFGMDPKLSPTRAPDSAPSCGCMGQLPPDANHRCACPGSPEECEGGSSIAPASPASFGAGQLFMPTGNPSSLCSQGEPAALADPHCVDAELEEGEIPVLPIPASLLCADSGESLGLSDTGDILDALLKAKRFPSTGKDVGLSSEDPSYRSSSSDSDWEKHLGRTAHPLLSPRGCHCLRSVGAARTDCDSSSSVSSGCSEGCSEEWGSPRAEEGCWWPAGSWNASSRHVPPYVNITDSRGISRDYLNFTVTTKCLGRMGSSQPSGRPSTGTGQAHSLESPMGTWKGFEEITQHTLDMEHLRFHFKLKQILRSGTPPLSTSCSIFPRDCSPQASSVRGAPAPHSLRSRSPLQVTILPSDTWPRGLRTHQRRSHHRDPSHCPPSWDTRWWQRSRASSPNQGCAAPFHLNKLKYENELKDSRGDISVILDEYAEFNRVMLSRLDTGGEGRGKGLAHGEATSVSPPRRTAAFQDVIAELCSTLQFRLRSVAEEACRQPGMFYLVETGEEPFFARVKALLKKDGHVEIEPLSFCKTKHRDTKWLLVVIRNEDISSHIHKVPCLLRLKHCPNVVFAGVDSPEDITGQTYQELFHTGGFVVSDDEVLETVTLGQLKEVVKILEKLNGSGRWKWLLHYKESKKLRENVRVDANAQRKNLILKSCQDLVEVLHYHACDSSSSPVSEHVKCLLNLQVQHVGARFAVYLTEKPSVSRELFESKGILVADISTFLGMAQKVAAPWRRSCWSLRSQVRAYTSENKEAWPLCSYRKRIPTFVMGLHGFHMARQLAGKKLSSAERRPRRVKTPQEHRVHLLGLNGEVCSRSAFTSSNLLSRGARRAGNHLQAVKIRAPSRSRSQQHLQYGRMSSSVPGSQTQTPACSQHCITVPRAESWGGTRRPNLSAVRLIIPDVRACSISSNSGLKMRCDYSPPPPPCS